LLDRSTDAEEHGLDPNAKGLNIEGNDLEAERKIISQILAGDLEKYYDLIAPIERRVYHTAYEILGSPADAEEVAQEAILKGFRNLSSFRGESKFSTWLFRITVNESRMRLRRKKEVSLELLGTGDGEEEYTPIQISDWREIPGDALLDKELAAHLSAAIDNLTPSYREVLILRDIDELSIAETAEVLNISIPTVKTRLLRARLMLRDYFITNGIMSVSGSRVKGRQ
jgi:RNA polymerase sigma-70 factor, ECF subfamily